MTTDDPITYHALHCPRILSRPCSFSSLFSLSTSLQLPLFLFSQRHVIAVGCRASVRLTEESSCPNNMVQNSLAAVSSDDLFVCLIYGCVRVFCTRPFFKLFHPCPSFFPFLLVIGFGFVSASTPLVLLQQQEYMLLFPFFLLQRAFPLCSSWARLPRK